ncbi:hypothetical protein MMC13_002934 [Lambiella insularis]|nr:hypothetical protein [Lambiella insularis]
MGLKFLDLLIGLSAPDRQGSANAITDPVVQRACQERHQTFEKHFALLSACVPTSHLLLPIVEIIWLLVRRTADLPAFDPLFTTQPVERITQLDQPSKDHPIPTSSGNLSHNTTLALLELVRIAYKDIDFEYGMSALSRGSKTKLKRLNGGVDGAAIETQPNNSTTQSDDAVRISLPIPFSITAPMAAPDQHTTSTSLLLPKSLLSNETYSQLQTNEHLPLGDGAAEFGTSQEVERDNRSSSLSDIEERHIVEAADKLHDKSSSISEEEEDTEAETERLEVSPQKLRKHENVLFSVFQRPADSGHADTGQTVDSGNGIVGAANVSSKAKPNTVNGNINDDAMDQTSDISSLDDSAEEASRATSPSSISGRKRKRSSRRNMTETDPAAVNSLKKAAGQLASSIIQDINRQQIHKPESAMTHETVEERVCEDDDGSTAAGEDASHPLPLTQFSKTRTNRVDERSAALAADMTDSRAVSPGIEGIDANGERMAVVDSGTEDADMEDSNPAMDADAVVRNEEQVLKKKAAMDLLGTIEKQFATLRDKLYEDRINHLNDELAMLNQPKITHPDYLTMVDCIDKRRDEKILQANIRLRYKFETLQRKSIAERAIAHSQYMQTVREQRDTILEQANKEWYQIQRERRTCDEDDSSYLYEFTTRRSQQIVRQAAYNAEVSVLSGFAKYKGFPAAPEISPAKPEQIQDDLQKMGIQSPTRVGPAHMTASLSNLSRQRPAAEEQFIEQTPWANPHHPIHHQIITAAQRQASLQSRPLSPFTTPAPPRRLIDTGPANGSASTIAALQSARNSSVVPTPASLDPDRNMLQRSELVPDDAQLTGTPSKHNGYILQESVASAHGTARPTLENVSDSFSDDFAPPLIQARSAGSPPSKLHTSLDETARSISRNPFSLPTKIPEEPEASSAEQNLFVAFQRLPRQIRVNAGLDRGNS